VVGPSPNSALLTDAYLVLRASSGAANRGRWADSRLDLCRLRIKRGGVLWLVDAELPAAWQRKPSDRAPALLVDGRALHVLLLHVGDKRLHVIAH